MNIIATDNATHTQDQAAIDHSRRRIRRGRQARSSPAWRPQTVALTRDELRLIVLDALG